MIMLYEGDSRTRFIRVSKDLSIRARLSYCCRDASSYRAPWLRGNSQVSKGKRDDRGVLMDHAAASCHLLPHDVAEDAALLRSKVLPGAFDLVAHEARHDGERDQL